MFKPIFIVVGVAAVAASLFVGCNNPANSGGNRLVGDWSEVGATYLSVKSTGDSVVDSRKMRDDEKLVVSFKSENDFVSTDFHKIADFWIESGTSGRYGIRGDTVCVVTGGEEACIKYDVSGNNLTLSIGYTSSYDDGESEYRSQTFQYVKGNLANIKKSLGKVYSRDPALIRTEWTRRSGPDGREDNIAFDYEFYDRNDVYLSGDYDESTWYTDDSRVFLVGLGCDKWERNTYDDGGYEEYCASYFVMNTVTIPYLLEEGRLRLRPAGSSSWDVWAPYDDGVVWHSQSKAKTGPERAKRAVNPFQAFRR